MTANGKKILDIINESRDHLTAEQVFLTLKNAGNKVSVATVYNNLNTLYEEGLIRKISVKSQPDHYDRLLRHDHLICTKCGHIWDLMLSDLKESIENESGVKITDYDLQAFYICADCRDNTAQ